MKVKARTLIPMLILAAVCLIAPVNTAYAKYRSLSDQELAQKFAPVLYFHPAEIFRPQPVDVLVNTARLREQRRFWFDINVLPNVSISDLFDYRAENFFLDAWNSSEGSSDSMNYSSHRTYYQNALSPEAGGPPIATYARVVRDEPSGYTTIQYWLFYYYNDWFNKHEGDWEMAQVILGENEEPEWMVLSQHHGGTRRPWNMVLVEQGTHPAIYIGLGSHANYFWGNEIYPNGKVIGNARVEIMDRTGTFDRVIPEVIPIPDLSGAEENLIDFSGWEWIFFAGHWGETAQQSDFAGPYGPAYKGEQWEHPYTWGISQPLDTDIWYANRLRVEVKGDAANIKLSSSRSDLLESADAMGGLALLHRDPVADEIITAEIEVAPERPFSIAATWPDSSLSQVTHYYYDDLPLSPTGRAALTLPAGETPSLIIAGESQKISPLSMETETLTWDAPDLVWVVGFLPPSDVLKGLVISLLAGWLPAFLYVGILYWADRYEKEPANLLAAAFLWGAFPALMIAVLANLFFHLPPEMLGANAVDAIWTGFVGPLVEEALKGAVVLFIALRYRREFESVLDGIIYGAMVGIGFAMNANIVSYLGSFITRGYTGLSFTILLEGIFFGLNHALYSAIFGAGLGYARLSTKRWGRWVFPFAAYLLAVLSHALHNLALRNVAGFNLLTVGLTLTGVLIVALLVVYLLKRQHKCLQVELLDELPDELYQTVLRPAAKAKAQWRSLRRGGFRAWRKTRYLHQLCAEYAFKRMQARISSEEEGIATQAKALREEIGVLIEKDELG